MCLLWLLVQFVVLLMYWDVPPISSEVGGVLLEMKGERPGEEEAPLMGSEEENAPSYRAVGGASEARGERRVHGDTAASSPFRNFSASRGEPESLPGRVFKAIRPEFLCFVYVEMNLKGNSGRMWENRAGLFNKRVFFGGELQHNYVENRV